MTRHRVLSALCAGGTALALAACGSSDNAGSKEGPVTVGVLTSLSGPLSVYAKSIRQTAELAVSEVNKAGGVDGRQVKLVFADDKGDPQTGATEARRLAESGAAAVIQPGAGFVRDAAVPATARSGTLMFLPWNNEDTDVLCSPNVWVSGQVADQQIPGTIAYAVEHGPKRWYLLGSDYSFPRGLAPAIKAALEKNGATMVGEDYLPLGTTNFGSITAKVKEAGPDVGVIANLAGSDLIGFVKQYAQAGGRTDQLVSFTIDEPTLAAIGKSGTGMLTGTDYAASDPSSGNQEYLKALTGRYGEDMSRPSSLSDSIRDTIHLWAEAADDAGSTDADAVADALPDASFSGQRGTVRFRDDHFMALPLRVLKARPDGTFEIVDEKPTIQPTTSC